jgi:hypothetical protein
MSGIHCCASYERFRFKRLLGEISKVRGQGVAWYVHNNQSKLMSVKTITAACYPVPGMPQHPQR